MRYVSRRVGLGVVVCTLGVLALVSIGCKTGADEPTPTPTPVVDKGDQGDVSTPGPPTKADQALALANNHFGFALLAKLLAAQAKGNVFISPSSIAMALDMALAGAVGNTQQAMMKALAMKGLTPGDVDQANLDLRKALANPDKEVQLSIANSLWLSKGIDFVPGFLDIGTKSYGAKVSSLDFSSPDAGKTINAWVKDNTGGKIPEIVADGPMAGMVCVLVNAVYFVGRWTDVFDKAQTKPHPFTLLDGTKKDLPMMTQSGEYEYVKQPGFEAIRLPYGTKRVAMYIFLPDKSTNVGALCKKLGEGGWENWTEGMEETPGQITLPKFRAEYGVQLNDALQAMGMSVAFDPAKADFSKMCGKPGDAWIGQVIHKTFVEVDEEGTKAAAATAIQMPGAAAPRPVTPFNMVVDRPFFCAIVDSLTNTILFMGAIVSPGAIGG
jgi:serpin B